VKVLGRDEGVSLAGEADGVRASLTLSSCVLPPILLEGVELAGLTERSPVNRRLT
jgi:hypothetical protein